MDTAWVGTKARVRTKALVRANWIRAKARVRAKALVMATAWFGTEGRVRAAAWVRAKARVRVRPGFGLIPWRWGGVCIIRPRYVSPSLNSFALPPPDQTRAGGDAEYFSARPVIYSVSEMAITLCRLAPVWRPF